LDAHEKRLGVSKVGRIKVRVHCPVEGTPKTAAIRRTATGKWLVAVAGEGEGEPTPLPPVHRALGSAVGLKVCAMPTEGDPIPNPRVFRVEEHARAKAQRTHQVALDAQKAIPVRRSLLTPSKSTPTWKRGRCGRW
jgi:putative transposase